MVGDSVLIVEDEAIVAADLERQLSDLGYDVLGVADSREQAIELIAQAVPDLILMDIRLRGQRDGIEVAEEIRRNHDLPVIFLTSYSDDETVRRASRTAAYGYLTKPYQIKELRAGIEVALMKSRMEKQLREVDRWFAHTLQCVSDGVIVTDLDGRIRFVNPAAEQLTGWPIDEAVGREVGDIVRFRVRERTEDANTPAKSPLRHEDAAAIVETVLKQGRPLPVDYGLKLIARDGSDGKVVDETAAPVNDDGGNRLGAVLVLRDSTERIAQEMLLRASEERFRNAFDNAPLGMALVSLAGEFIQVNDALCHILESSAEELKRRGYGAVTLEGDGGHEVRRLQELATSGQGVVQFERRYLRLNGGDPVWTLVSVSLLHEGGRPTCYLYQVHDLTAQKKAAEHLAELAAERLKRQSSELAGEAKDGFLSRVSHELRTPLNAVMGFAQLLELEQCADPAKSAAYATHIRVAGDHLLVLVEDLLDLNRAAEGRLNVIPQAVGLAGAVEESLHMLERMAETHGVELETSVPADLFVIADAMRLRQVLLNVGSNAIKYNRQGGSVRFCANLVETGPVRLTIEDTGVGMTHEQLERLFRPFERLGQERSRIPGTGLGLVIARSVVVEMGGTLNVTSAPHAGTTVAIELPGVR